MNKLIKTAKAAPIKAEPLDSVNHATTTSVALVKANSAQTKPVKPLSPSEKELLAECEDIIAKGLKSFKAVFDALLPVYEQELYRMEYGTFEEYCRKKWDISARHANRLISASGVVANLQSDQLVSSEPVAIPENEAQARPLTSLEPAKQVEAAKIVAKKPGRQTTKDFVEAAAEVTGKKGNSLKSDTDEEEKPRVKMYDPVDQEPEPVKPDTSNANLEGLMELVDEAQTLARKTDGCSDVVKMLGDVAKVITRKLNGGAK